MKRYGLVGHPLAHSFSRAYFNEKFQREQLECQYDNFDLADLQGVRELTQRFPDLQGFNVTIPYKQDIIAFLDELDETAAEVGAVNTVKVLASGTLKGFNTDVLGFRDMITPFLPQHPSHPALILGTGGASKAVQYVLRHIGMPYHTVSRSPHCGDYTYDTLDDTVIKSHLLIVNTTPLGTFPNIDEAPPIPYQAITPQHVLVDLVYNPEETCFLRRGKQQGADTVNGLQMLHRQAEASWKLWNLDGQNSKQHTILEG